MKTLVKSTLMAAALTMAAISGAPAANVDGPSVFWKWSVWGNPRAFTAGVEKLAERVAEETDGKFKIQIFYGGQLAKSKEHLDGIKNNLDTPAPVNKDIFAMTQAEKDEAGIASMPGSLREALDVMLDNPIAKETLGEHIFSKYVEGKNAEWDAFRTAVT